MHTIKVQDIPFGKFRDKGQPVDNLSNFNSSKEQICCLIAEEQLPDTTFLFVTSDCLLKLVEGNEFVAGKRTIVAAKLNDHQQLLVVQSIQSNDSLILETKKGYYLRFPVNEIPQKKKTALGVRGMKLGTGDCLMEAHLLKEGEELVVERTGKEIALHRLHMAKRDGKGIKK